MQNPGEFRRAFFKARIFRHLDTLYAGYMKSGVVNGAILLAWCMYQVD